MRRVALGAIVAAILAILVLHGIAGPTGLIFPVGTPSTSQPGMPATPGTPNPGQPGTPGTPNPGQPGTPGTVQPGVSLAPVTVWQDVWTFLGFQDRTYLVIQTEAEWWQLLSHIQVNPDKPWEVDFRSRTVLVAIYGVAPTTGYNIEIKDVVSTSGGALRVLVEVTAPGSGCGTGEALTFPMHIVSIPKSDGPFVFEEKEVINFCG